jgi:hypothetical protein
MNRFAHIKTVRGFKDLAGGFRHAFLNTSGPYQVFKMARVGRRASRMLMKAPMAGKGPSTGILRGHRMAYRRSRLGRRDRKSETGMLRFEAMTKRAWGVDRRVTGSVSGRTEDCFSSNQIPGWGSGFGCVSVRWICEALSRTLSRPTLVYCFFFCSGFDDRFQRAHRNFPKKFSKVVSAEIRESGVQSPATSSFFCTGLVSRAGGFFLLGLLGVYSG